MELYTHFALVLLMTIIIECGTAFLLGYRDKFVLISIILINVITNPAINVIVMLMVYLQIGSIISFIVYPLEVIVVLVEWQLLKYATHNTIKNPLRLAIIMNAVSYAVGVFVFGHI